MASIEGETTTNLMAVDEGNSQDDLPSDLSAAPSARFGRWGIAVCTVAAVVAMALLATRGTAPRGQMATGSMELVTELASSNDRAQFLSKVNAQRSQHGLTHVCYNQKLNNVANQAAGNGWGGGQWSQAIHQSGYTMKQPGPKMMSGTGQTSAIEFFNAVHSNRFLNPGHTHLGLGKQGTEWAVIFATSSQDSCTPITAVGSGSSFSLPTSTCEDSVGPGQAEWEDTDGWNCAQYATGNNCQDHGWKTQYAKFDMTANTACCACGGGCTDKGAPGGAKWEDTDGWDCAKYAEGNNCEDHGHKSHYAKFGMTANTACCACGGGT